MLDDLYTEKIDFPKGFIVFNITGKKFCLDIDHVLTIVNSKELSLPHFSISYDTGTINYLDENFPLIDFTAANRLNFSPQKKFRCIIFLSYKGNKIALFADQIVDYISVTKTMEDSIKFYPVKNKSYLMGFIQYEDKNFLLLDLEQILVDITKNQIAFNSCGKSFDDQKNL